MTSRPCTAIPYLAGLRRRDKHGSIIVVFAKFAGRIACCWYLKRKLYGCSKWWWGSTLYENWNDLGEGWPQPTGDLAMMEQDEKSTIFSLGVGSINPYLLYGDSYCVDNQPVDSTIALHIGSLGFGSRSIIRRIYRRKWTSTTRNMQPAFELSSTRYLVINVKLLDDLAN
jgi:hypothetical protein